MAEGVVNVSQQCVFSAFDQQPGNLSESGEAGGDVQERPCAMERESRLQRRRSSQCPFPGQWVSEFLGCSVRLDQ